MPKDTFHQIMLMIMGDLIEKLTEQCIIQQELSTGKDLSEVIEWMRTDGPNEMGPRYILLAYKAAGYIHNRLENDFNLKTYEENDELDALNQPKIQAKFWEHLGVYMTEHHLIKGEEGSPYGQFSIDDISELNTLTDDPNYEAGQQDAINAAVDEMIMKPGPKKEELIN
jgi:hypothetical protein